MPDVPYYLDGRLSSLLKSMDDCGVDISVVSSIATKVSQYESILKWSLEIASDRIVPFASIHPGDEQAERNIDRIAESGLKGIKMHPYYQEFYLDEPKMKRIYRRINDNGLILLMHTGYDVAFERIDRAGPKRIISVVNEFPDLKFISTHLGAWQQWDDVLKYMAGKPVYIGTSFSLDYIDPALAKEILSAHSNEYLLFGTDSPWDDQKRAQEQIKSLDIDNLDLEALFCKNAQKILS